jgi:hypothetical protein
VQVCILEILTEGENVLEMYLNHSSDLMAVLCQPFPLALHQKTRDPANTAAGMLKAFMREQPSHFRITGFLRASPV